MTHLVFLPHDGAVIVNEVDEGAESLAARITAGEWQPPPPYHKTTLSKGGLRALAWDNLVVVMPIDYISQPDHNRGSGLTDLDMEILQCASEGMNNKEIAQRFNLSLRSVSRHIDKIKERMGVETRAQTLARATQLGLIRMKKR